jgi:hypothetical protein
VSHVSGDDREIHYLQGKAKMKNGKNFSRNRPRADREKADYYQTPYCLTEEFIKAHVLNNWPEGSLIADFCCGEGAMVKVINDNGYEVIHCDIKHDNKFTYSQDFFSISNVYDYGLMNPPFRLFNKWVEHCFDVFTIGFALLAPTTYLQGVSRFNRGGTGIFQKHEYP